MFPWSSAMTADVPCQPVGVRHRLTPWQRHLGLLGLAFLILLVLAGGDAGGGIIAAWTRTGAFHHCFLILPIVGWLIWQQRPVLAGVTPAFSVAGCAIVGAGSLLWLAGAAGFVDLFRQAAFVICALGLVVALLGTPVARTLKFPLAYALFLIPIGSEFEPALQVLTACVAVALLHATGVPALLEGVFIATPIGLFRVAEACSGTGFLLAMAAYAALVCHLCFKSPVRRALFAGVAMILALLANGIRAWAIMLIANHSSMANPIVSNHIIYGWLLFALVIALLIWGASRWFDRKPDDVPIIQIAGRQRWRARTVLPILALFLVLPRIWLLASEAPDHGVSPPPTAPRVAGWTVPPGPFLPRWQPHFNGASWIGQWRYIDQSGRAVDLAIIIFDRQSAGRELVGFGQGAAPSEGAWAEAGDAVAPLNGRGEWLRGPGGTRRYAATFYLADGRVTGSKAAAKLATIRARLLGGQQGAMAILVSAEGQNPVEIVRHFLNAAGSVQELADRAHPIR